MIIILSSLIALKLLMLSILTNVEKEKEALKRNDTIFRC